MVTNALNVVDKLLFVCLCFASGTEGGANTFGQHKMRFI